MLINYYSDIFISRQGKIKKIISENVKIVKISNEKIRIIHNYSVKIFVGLENKRE